MNWDRSSEREPVVLKSRRGERVSFEGVSHSADRRQARRKGVGGADPVKLFGAALRLTPVLKVAMQSLKQRSIGSDDNDPKKDFSFNREGP
jgi:hypothetical protein